MTAFFIFIVYFHRRFVHIHKLFYEIGNILVTQQQDLSNYISYITDILPTAKDINIHFAQAAQEKEKGK